MSIGILFWFIWVVGLFFGGFGVFRSAPESRWIGGSSLIVWVALGLLGWKVFGPLLQ